MPPTPTRREAFRPQYPPHQYAQQNQYFDPRQMPPTPAERMFQPASVAQPHEASQKQQDPRRDPTPRNSLFDFMRSPQPDVRPPSPQSGAGARPYNVAEEIHRVSWGGAPRREPGIVAAETPTIAEYQGMPINLPLTSAADAFCGQSHSASTKEEIHGIPATLPGKEKTSATTPLPPPPPTSTISAPSQPQVRPQQPRPLQAKPPTQPPPTITNPVASSGTTNPNSEAAHTRNQVQFNDLVDENKPHHSQLEKKDGRGRKLLGGIFGRGKRKQKQTRSINNKYDARREDDEHYHDGSIISDAILRDRHDRFVTKL